jgi:ligand-binding SRPBCC domain-containing protein
VHLTPPDMHMQVMTELPVEVKQDLLLDYRLKVRGLPLRWRSRISLWDPPVRFADEMVKGPYRMWIHLHTFEPEAGGTRVEDRVIYAVYGGKMINKLFVAKDVERVFDYRRQRLVELFNAK